jgi:hypothetical protein
MTSKLKFNTAIILALPDDIKTTNKGFIQTFGLTTFQKEVLPHTQPRVTKILTTKPTPFLAFYVNVLGRTVAHRLDMEYEPWLWQEKEEDHD